MFAERYLNALSTSNLQDDDQHHQTEPLVAAALADLSGGSGALFGTMLLRASIAGVPRQAIASSARDLGVLLHVWTGEVARMGFDRKWMNIKAEWDIKCRVCRVCHVRQDRARQPSVMAERRVLGMQRGKGRGQPDLHLLRW